jgi:hypothetical protein
MTPYCDVVCTFIAEWLTQQNVTVFLGSEVSYRNCVRIT